MIAENLQIFFQYGFTFYLQYLINHGEYFQVCEHPSGEIMGYGKFFRISNRQAEVSLLNRFVL